MVGNKFVLGNNAWGKMNVESFLSVWFLRPENAALGFLRASSVWKSGFTFSGTTLDISCGDGVFMFLLLGGEFCQEFDVFLDVANTKLLQLTQDKVTDIFDSYEEHYQLDHIIEKYPETTITYGTDWKASLLKKAERLRIYEHLLQHDNNLPFHFPDENFDRMYSNSVYWVDNVEMHLREIVRITKPQGEILLQIKTPDFIQLHPQFWGTSWLSQESLNILDRGRLATWPSIREIDWYVRTIEELGCQLLEKIPVYSRQQVEIWHVGLRPIAHFLIYLFNRLPLEERTELKKEFVQYIYPLVRDMVNIPIDEGDGYEFTLRFVKKAL